MVNAGLCTMKRTFPILLRLVVGFLVLSSCVGGQAATQPPAVSNPTPLPPVKADDRVVADGRVVPILSADLSLPTGGIVAEVFVSEGDQVAPGQLLLRLNAARQLAGVAQAEADVRRAQARLDLVRAGARSPEIEAARAAVDAAQARVDSLTQGPRPEELAAAEASLAAAQAALTAATSGASREQIAAAQAELANAEAVLRQAQALYDRIASAPDVGLRPEALQLERATNAYNAAKARYEELKRGPNPAEVASARAQVARTQAELDVLRAPARPSDLAAAQAELRRVQAQLDLLVAGPQPEEVRVAEADVAAAEAALTQARALLSEAELRAPFAGTVAALEVGVGQQATPGAPLVRLADFSSWLVETRDLTELRIVNVKEGDSALIFVDALPGLALTGRVLRIRPIGESRQGDITYTVLVKPDSFDQRLRWNMTAKVTIQPGRGD